jgi:hypothetical protein
MVHATGKGKKGAKARAAAETLRNRILGYADCCYDTDE